MCSEAWNRVPVRTFQPLAGTGSTVILGLNLKYLLQKKPGIIFYIPGYLQVLHMTGGPLPHGTIEN